MSPQEISEPPLVSAIVRTMGRATLARALDCIAARQHRPIEIVLVDASGQSGAGAGENLDRDRVLAERERLMRKWSA